MNEMIISLVLASASSVMALLALVGLFRKAQAEPVRVKIRVDDERE